jgi:dTDP-4-amino-4,6-dideoxygalactose transaminase
MQELGFNYRLTDMQAALGCSQLDRLDDFKARRREIVKKYSQAFKEIPWLTIPTETVGVSSCFHLYVLRIRYEEIGKNRREVMEELQSKSIGTQVHYIPVNQLPYYQGISRENTPNAESYYEQCLSIPLYPRMGDSDVDHVINAITSLGK